MSIPTPTAPAAPASAPTRVDWAPVPRVNLLPPEIISDRSFHRTQRILAGVVAAVVLLVVALFWWAQSAVTSAEDALADEQAVTAQLQSEQAQYAEVPRVIAQVEAAEAARETAMANDVAWYRFLNDVALVTPGQVWLTNLSATVPVPGEAGTAQGQADVVPLATAGLGTLTVTGIASGYPDVSAWLDALDSIEGLEASILDTAIRELDDETPADQGRVTFTTRITVTDAALTHRYDRKAS